MADPDFTLRTWKGFSIEMRNRLEDESAFDDLLCSTSCVVSDLHATQESSKRQSSRRPLKDDISRIWWKKKYRVKKKGCVSFAPIRIHKGLSLPAVISFVK